MYKKYKNFQYRKKSDGRWEIVFPGGFKSTLSLNSEADVIAKIEALRAQFGDVREE